MSDPKTVTGNQDESVAHVGPVEGDRGIPQVGRKKPASRIWYVMVAGTLIVAVIALAAVAGLNKLKNRNAGKVQEKDNVTSNVPELTAGAFQASQEAPPLPEGTAPAPTPAQPGQPATAQGEPKLTPAQQKAIDLAERRKRAPVLGISGRMSGSGDGEDGPQDGTQREGNGSGSLGAALKATRTGAVSATVLPDPNMTLTMGRLLQCTLETAISTDVPGMTSCVLAQDVYSTTGRVLLLERGTRIVGQYQSGSVKRGQSRVFVLWTRAETPNGVIVNLDSPATDALGRSGVDGKLNRHFWERFGSALLVSLVDDVASYMVAKERNGSGGNTAINFGSTADSGNDAAAIIVENSVNIPPTLNKSQGESIGIFVARDLYFGDVYELRPNRSMQ